MNIFLKSFGLLFSLINSVIKIIQNIYIIGSIKINLENPIEIGERLMKKEKR